MNFKSLLDPLSQNMHLVILALYAYVLLMHVKEDEYVKMIVLTVATCMAICYLKKQGALPKVNLPKVGLPKVVEGNSQCGSKTVEAMTNKPKKQVKKQVKKPIKKRRVKEGFENGTASDSAPGGAVVRQLPGVMGPYDGLCFNTGNQQYWMKSPDEISLIPNDALFTYLSSQGPLKPVFTDNSSLTGTPVDGKEGSPKKMFMFANNRSSPNCCPSTFSTSTGCVCTTKNQRDFVSGRGGQGPVHLDM